MSFISVDIESDGPIPGPYSIVCFGAVIVKPGLEDTFYGQIKPISEQWNANALAVSGFTREDHLKFPDPVITMLSFSDWIENNSKGRPILISDNNGYDFSFINWYFHNFLGKSPFGWSSRRIGDLYCGLVKDSFAKWKHLRKTVHDHNPLNDAKGNAEALLKMKDMGLKFDFK